MDCIKTLAGKKNTICIMITIGEFILHLPVELCKRSEAKIVLKTIKKNSSSLV